MYPLLNGFSFAVSVNIFPVLPLPEFPRQMSEFHCESAGLLSSIGLGEFPCIFPQNREVRNGDRFADDCLHRQGLTAENLRQRADKAIKTNSAPSDRPAVVSPCAFSW
jgi:hypothetical protein